MRKEKRDFIVILVCDNIPNQKFWNKEKEDWTSNIDEATIYHEYVDAVHCIWKEIPKEKVLARITTMEKYFYDLMDGFSTLPGELKEND